MAENHQRSAAQERVKITFEADRATIDSLRAIATYEHRTLSAQLRVICEDAVAAVEGEAAA